MRSISRRGFIATSGAALGALPFVRSIDALAQVTNPVFRHGVASGDPLGDRVILWTRVTPKAATGAQRVSWVLARDPKLAQVVSRGEAETGAARDFTVKVDANGLEPGTPYYYRFESMGERSAIGRTRTLPASGVAQLRLGVVSCSNLPQGYFNAYACLANRADLDAILHLGDYIYEYANEQYGDGTSARPRADARTRRSSRCRIIASGMRSTKPIPIRRQCTASIRSSSPGTITSSPTTPGVAAPRTTHDGERKVSGPRGAAAAVQAYYEWMPIREDAQTLQDRIYRTFRFGNMATLFMLDTRLVGRDQEVPRDDTATIELPNRQLLGAEQEGWLAEQLVSSVRNESRWNLLGQQVMFAPQTQSGVRASNPDSWDGYRAARGRVFDMIERARMDNLCVLTGDVHSSWAYDLPRDPFRGYDKATGKGSVGVEFAGTSVSSPSNLGRGPEGPKQLADAMAARPHLHYVDGRYRGYFVLDLTRERLQADFYAVATVEERNTTERFEKGFITESGRNHLIEASTPAKGAAAPDPAPL